MAIHCILPSAPLLPEKNGAFFTQKCTGKLRLDAARQKGSGRAGKSWASAVARPVAPSAITAHLNALRSSAFLLFAELGLCVDPERQHRAANRARVRMSALRPMAARLDKAEHHCVQPASYYFAFLFRWLCFNHRDAPSVHDANVRTAPCMSNCLVMQRLLTSSSAPLILPSSPGGPSTMATNFPSTTSWPATATRHASWISVS